jgi:hypothetical protein
MYKIKNILLNYEGRTRRQTSSYLVPHGYQVKKKKIWTVYGLRFMRLDLINTLR